MSSRWAWLTNDTRSFKDRLLLIVPPSAFFCYTILFCAPVQIYLNNYDEFWFNLSIFCWISLLLCIVAFAVCMVAGIILRGKVLDLYVSFLFGMALVLYLQGNYLNISYGELNGQMVDWSKYGKYGLINTIITTAILHLPLVIRLFYQKIWRLMIRFVSCLCIFMQLAGLVSLYIPYRKVAASQAYAMGWDGVSSYSKNQNLVLLILDSFDEPFFMEYLSAHPEETDQLDGFTYFHNTCAISTSTMFSMAPMLTGEVCTWEYGLFAEYLDDAWNQEKLFHRLKEAGYDIRALTTSSSKYGYLGSVGVSYFENRKLAENRTSSYTEFLSLLYSLVLFTYLPHFFKSGFWIVPDDFSYLGRSNDYYDDNDPSSFVRMGKEPISADRTENVFRLYHFKSVHPPINLGPDATWQPVEETSFLDAEEGSFAIVHRILNQMRDAGIYDSSSIIIAADHGSTFHVSGELEGGLTCPLLLYKPAGAHGKMQISEAPASLFDIRSTLLQDAGLKWEDEGIPLSALQEGMERIRYFYRVLPSHKSLYELKVGSEYAGDISNYTVTGKAYYAPGEHE